MWESAQELCESRGGRPGLPVPNMVSVDLQHWTWTWTKPTELRNFMKVAVATVKQQGTELKFGKNMFAAFDKEGGKGGGGG